MQGHGRRSGRRVSRVRHHRCIEGLESRRLLNAADLDTSFSGDGQYLSGDAPADVGTAVKRQGDGKLVVAGTLITNAPTFDFAFYVQRFNEDGTLDSDFGAGGRVTTEFTPGSDLANDVLIQTDGKIIALGVANGAFGSNSSFAMVRYVPDGTPDGSFGTAGLVMTDLGSGLDSILGAVLQSDGKIVVAGLSTSAGGVEQFTVARYLTDGTLDDSFGTGGVVVTPFNEFASSAAAVAIDADGKIVVAGTSLSSTQTSSENFAVARYNEDGSLDETFDADGKVIVNFENASDRAAAIAIQNDGKILVAGEASGFTTKAHFAAARLNANGSLDTTWAGDGTLRLPLDAQANRSGALAVLVHSDGRVVLAGQQYPAAGTATDFALARLTETGELDPTFGGTGIRMLDFGGNSSDQAGDAVFVAGEGIVMVGSSNGGTTARPFETAIAQFKGGVDFATLRLGTLSVVGTAGDDTIEIARSGQDYAVTRNGVTNTISPAMQPAGAVTLNVLTIGGNDTVNVIGLVRPGTISLGAGDDAVTLSGAGVGTQPLVIDGAAGGDTLNVAANLVVPVTFSGGIATGGGPNVIHFTGSDAADTIDVSNASISGAGTSVGFSNIQSVNLSAGGGNDVINWANDRAAALDLGDGDDTINFNRGSFLAIVTVSGGAGDDVVVATTGGAGANVTFDPGAGADKVIYEGRDFIDTVGFSKTEVAGIPIVRFTDLELLVVSGNGDDDDISGTVSPDGPSVEINGGGGNDGITVTFEAGARATVNGGDGADTLNLAATAGNDTVTLGETSIGVNGESVPFTSVEKVSLNGAGGSDTIVYDGSLNLPTLDVAGGGGGTDVLRLTGGDGADAFTLVSNFRLMHGAKIIGLSGISEIALDDSAGADAIDVQGSILVKLGPGQELASLTIGAEGRVEMAGSNHTLRTDALTIADGGRLDVGRGTLHVTGGEVRAIEALMKTARNGAIRWAGPGIGTSEASTLTGLCAAEDAGGGVRVKYTYNGDVNLDGRINFDDYFQIDQAFLLQLPAPLCRQGDFNFDDVINFDDYFVIDSAFLGQGSPLMATNPIAATGEDGERAWRAAAASKRAAREGVWETKPQVRRAARRGR